MSTAILVTTTFEHHDEAEKMATQLLEKRLIACAQIGGPITSCYWWNGKIENGKEYVLSMKSTELLYEKLESTIIGIHTYEVPEIIATPITKISRHYLEWMDQELRG